MVKKFSKVVEKGSGNGKIFEKSELLDDVYYEFAISSEFISSESFNDTQILEGQKKISGSLKLLNKMIDLYGKSLLLELSDKQKWNIEIPGGDFINRKYRFTVSSFYDPMNT